MSKSLKTQKNLRSNVSETPGISPDQDKGDTPAAEELQSQDIGRDMNKIFASLAKIAEEVKGIEEIKRTTASTESKLTVMMTRLQEAEARLDFLESAERERQTNPPATKDDFALLKDKLEDLENRSRRNNVRFIWIPEDKVHGEMTDFIEKLIPDLLGIEKKCEVERAHRVPTQLAQPGGKPRPIIARFLRSSDRDLVLRAARKKGELICESHKILLFPDYSKSTQQRRDKFKECKKKLHERGMNFRLDFPAKLIIDTENGSKRFDCSRKAMAFIESIL